MEKKKIQQPKTSIHLCAHNQKGQIRGVQAHLILAFLTFHQVSRTAWYRDIYNTYICTQTFIWFACPEYEIVCLRTVLCFPYFFFFFSVYFHHSLAIFCLLAFCYCNVSSNIQNANFLLHKNVIKLSGFLYKQISAGRLMGCCTPSKEEILFNYLPYKIQ